MSFEPTLSFLPGTTQLQLKASPEAAVLRGQQPTFELVRPIWSAEAEARTRVAKRGGNPEDRRWVLSQMEVQAGQYRGQTFQWLLTHDLGYAVELLASHEADREGGDSSSTPLMLYKDTLLEYARLFPAVAASIISSKRRNMESEDDKLLGFGTYRSLTYRELYKSQDKEISSYRKYVLETIVRNAGSRLMQLQQYLKRRMGQEQSAAVSPPTTGTSKASVAASTPPPPSSKHQQTSSSTLKTAVPLSSSEDDDEWLMVEAPAAEQEPAASEFSSPSSPPLHLHPTAVAGLPAPTPREASPPPNPLLLPEAWKRCLPSEQHEWISKELFTRDPMGRPVLPRELRLWYYPPGPQPVYVQHPSSSDPFFQLPFFLWVPHRMWLYQLKCPHCAGKLTSCGLYNTICKVLDLDGWYYMATECLECRSCDIKVAAWCRSVREQLALYHQQLFPAVLAYRLSCDRKVLNQMKGESLDNSSSCLRSTLKVRHTEAWMRRCVGYLETCYKLEASGVSMEHPMPPLPQMPSIPSRSRLLSTYARKTFTRIDELRAKVTSTFGSILKMDSTKKMDKKLAGADAGTTQWVTSVANELGQVLNCVLTVAEGYGLSNMTLGLQERYQRAGQDPPVVLYVDRDCCMVDEGTCAASALFPAWPRLVVKLEVRHFLRRLAAGVTSTSHQLYPDFMRRLSACVFEWDPEDLARLKTAKQAEKCRGGSILKLKEMIRHCRRRTRGAEETERCLDDSIQEFMAVTDTMNVPLLDAARMKDIWKTQRRHVACIQDPPGVQLYTKVGQLTRGGVVLPVFRCARGPTSESFHPHLNRFIPGTSASSCHLQMYLLEGLAGWNEDRAQAAAGAASRRMKCNRGRLQHTLNQLSQHLLGQSLAESYTKPQEYTGELIGISYLYAQMDQVLQEFPDDPNEADGSEVLQEVEEEEEAEDKGEEFLLRSVDELDEGFDEGFDEVPEASLCPSTQPPCEQHQPSSQPDAGACGDPGGVPASSEETTGPDGQGGYQHVVQLARFLVDASRKGFITDAEVEQIVGMWQNLTDADKEQPAEGGEKNASVSQPGLESTKSLVMRPDKSRLVEAVLKELCALHPSSQRLAGATITRWILVLRDYNRIRMAVVSHPSLRARTTLKLFMVNQTTVAQWHKKWAASNERTTPSTSTSSSIPPIQAPVKVEEPLLSIKMEEAPPGPQELLVSRNLTLLQTKEEPVAGPSGTSGLLTGTSSAPPASPTQTSSSSQPSLSTQSSSSSQASSSTSVPLIPKSTAWNRKRLTMQQAEAAKRGQIIKIRAASVSTCRQCGLRRVKETGHRLLVKANGKRVYYCPMAANGKTQEEWLATLE